jgi:hypothetical protein
VTRLDTRLEETTGVGPAGHGHLSGAPWPTVAAVAAPVAVAAALIPWRTSLNTADDALVLVVIIVAVSGTGHRAAAALAALCSALAFDVFLTRPYGSLRITRRSDLITEILLVVVGVAVGQLAARGRSHRMAATSSRRRVAQLHGVTELMARGTDAEVVIDAAAAELCDVLSLRACHFVRGPLAGAGARVTPAGQVAVGHETWATDDLGLPTRTVDLPVRSGGWLVGHFLLTPTPGRPVTSEQLVVAVAIAGQVGAALAAEQGPTVWPPGRDPMADPRPMGS